MTKLSNRRGAESDELQKDYKPRRLLQRLVRPGYSVPVPLDAAACATASGTGPAATPRIPSSSP